MLYCYLIGIPWLLILRMTQISYFLPFTIKLIRLLKSMYHWHHKQVIDHTLEPSSAVYKSWVVGKRNCSFSTHWLISIYDLFPPPNISGFIAEWVGASAQYRDVTGLNPVEVLTFSGIYTHKCINCFHNLFMALVIRMAGTHFQSWPDFAIIPTAKSVREGTQDA